MTSKKKAAAPPSGPPHPERAVGVLKQGATPVSDTPATPAQKQIKDFEQAVQCFSQRRFQEAIQHFEETMRGPAPHVSDKARSYMQVCSRKIADSELKLSSAEDYFNYGVERLNARDIEQARVQFSRALALNPNAEYVLYTMALACGMAGDGEGAYENLKRAIELEPRNRILARQDPEFTALTQQIPLLRTLLHNDSTAPF